MIETLFSIAVVLVLFEFVRRKYGHTLVGRICTDILSNVLRLIHVLCQIFFKVMFWLIAVLTQAAFPKSNPNKFLNWIKSVFSGFSFPRFGSFSGGAGKPITATWKDKPFAYSSQDGIHALLGWTADRREVWFELGDDPAHAILAGMTRSGKSNLLHVLIQGLIHRFSSEELNLYLLDYKHGVEFDVYAKAKIPQIKYVATVNDSEYGIQALKHFHEEIIRRNDEFRRSGARNINEMRKTTGKQIPQTHALNHPWFECYRFAVSSNGLLYNDELVQNFIQKNNCNISIGISIDGTKQKHDRQRVFPDGEGSYDDIVKNVKLWQTQRQGEQTKATIGRGDLPFIKESVLHLWDLGIHSVAMNCIFEDVCSPYLLLQILRHQVFVIMKRRTGSQRLCRRIHYEKSPITH